MSADQVLESAWRVLIADDQRIFVDALTRLVDDEADMQVVNADQSIAELRVLLDGPAPDLVLLDYRFGDGDGLEVVPEVVRSWPDVCVLLVTGYASTYTREAAAVAGCSGVVSKTAHADELLAAMRAVLGGESVAAPSIRKAPTADVDLSARELQVLGMLATGATSNAIAARLGIRHTTARNHVQNVLRKLGVSSQLEAVLAGSRLGLVNPFGNARDGDQTGGG